MPCVISYPGCEGSFSCSAAEEIFPGSLLHGFSLFSEAVSALKDASADFAVLPTENSFAGTVIETFSLIQKFSVHIVGEHVKRISHQLLGLPGATLEGIRRISSHPQAIAQCDDFLSSLPGVQIITSLNTAISAREVSSSGDISLAAIASRESAEKYGLQILCPDIESSKQNFTRFLVLSRTPDSLYPPNKATVMFTIPNQIGSLARVLASFSESGLNMSRIESRPLPNTTFAYLFICDFEGSMDSCHLTTALDSARKFTNELRLLGVYQKACEKK